VAVPSPPSADASASETFVADRREVELLHTDGAVAYIRGPLQPRERFVTEGVARLTPGLEVRLLPTQGVSESDEKDDGETQS
ncbi:MAG: hypothetical protein AAF907_17935, partial [Planctomycetota bacterium]